MQQHLARRRHHRGKPAHSGLRDTLRRGEGRDPAGQVGRAGGDRGSGLVSHRGQPLHHRRGYSDRQRRDAQVELHLVRPEGRRQALMQP